MSEEASTEKHNISDVNGSPVVRDDASPHEPGFPSFSEPSETERRELDAFDQAFACMGDAEAGIMNSFAFALETEENTPGPHFNSLQRQRSAIDSLPTAPACPTNDFISRHGDSQHPNLEDLGYFVDASRVKPILKLLQDLPEVWHITFRLAQSWLKSATEEWPNDRIPAQRIISPLRDAFQDMDFDLGIVKDIRKGMFDLPQLQWWAEREYDIVERLPDALTRLAGLNMHDFRVRGGQVYGIVVVLLKLAERDEFMLPRKIRRILHGRAARPKLVKDRSHIFDNKLEAVRRQIVNVTLKYRRMTSVLKPLEELVEKLEEEIKCHEQNISSA
ncbi:hypothetical protein CC79DRAFT_203863 [Sarocladium strictum]